MKWNRLSKLLAAVLFFVGLCCFGCGGGEKKESHELAACQGCDGINCGVKQEASVLTTETPDPCSYLTIEEWQAYVDTVHSVLETKKVEYGDTDEVRLGVCVGHDQNEANPVLSVICSDMEYQLAYTVNEGEEQFSNTKVGDLLRFKTYGDDPHDANQCVGSLFFPEFVVLETGCVVPSAANNLATTSTQ